MASSMVRAIPNVLSASRIVLAAGFVAAEAGPVRLGLIGVAGLTDVLDGIVARRVNAASRWGALIDPVADRFFALTVIATLLIDGAITVPQYFALIMRDLATAVGFLVARAMPSLRSARFEARFVGKIVTVLQFLALVSALAHRPALDLLIACVVLASLMSIADYTWMLWKVRREEGRRVG